MRVLAVDTCGAEGSVALAEVDARALRLIEQRLLAGRSCAEMLMPAIRALLETHALAVKDLDAIVVVRGPGSFTGVRVGLSTAKGLAQAARLPVVGLSRLQVLAHAAGSRAAALDAGRGEVYFGKAGQESGEAVLHPDEVRAQVAEADVACCEDSVARSLPGARRVAAPTAEDALRLALERLRRGEFDDLAAMDAHYLRRSQAEVVADGAAR
ncbi:MULTISPECIES: tRNA (adenosine(37)-N6)-threonylcarbamoyltransferase complex dimerization subunit type 1 TsaB [Acidobacterium]|uniref:Peptidase family M22, nonpeptidase homolog n=1 Tax=Acidobacterium capsulatum (strain ATCC 51196 / DSM 11244 / BCRC 80197 / JCM 7670 / NBRC 15755 / NCIMB 13165 / 161) TaxID=240015 RepID=C1F3M9_ACIC5|nr:MULTISPECIES: tRNA (adenosine(37)-N6)-threonylcarbamoyltransferase complex dimerization subunit type 1 TsaB [Acidobacterium]ACO32501.1 peptidase family M22, nonpeptidase homolog [Acidobacterium capsulatum ATCC 51196]HCT60253.1 tRNA (adenosine(37)-N6)-threonylcarbamoyltransferase complex dimerization subunit type 1 TsaB [Acidobacterium sp.]